MMKVWLMVAFIHSPQMPSIKYQAYLYETEDQCMENLVLFKNSYEYKSQIYKLTTKADAHCLEFESFEIKRFKKTGT
tara:strand:+ start:605 stop:835 length:231 start_codon:yes stop_codon:yes gene_type:complete